jgi:hypothetical protein
MSDRFHRASMATAFEVGRLSVEIAQWIEADRRAAEDFRASGQLEAAQLFLRSADRRQEMLCRIAEQFNGHCEL